MDKLIDFLLEQPILIFLVIAGILGNLGSSTAAKKRKQQRERQREEQRRQQQQGTPAARPQSREQSGEDDLSRKIRELLEGGGRKTEARTSPRPAPTPTPPPPAPPPVEAPSTRYASGHDDTWLAEDIHIGFESELQEEREAAAALAAKSRPAPVAAPTAWDGSADSSFQALDWQSTFAGGLGGMASTAQLEVGGSRPRLPEDVRPRHAFELLVALGPCRAMRSYDEEQQSLL